jgi:hypothetical protein
MIDQKLTEEITQELGRLVRLPTGDMSTVEYQRHLIYLHVFTHTVRELLFKSTGRTAAEEVHDATN